MDSPRPSVARAALSRAARLLARRQRALLAHCGATQVHDLRVALRRARALLWSVKPWCDAAHYRACVRDLRYAGKLLQDARDIDVARQLISPCLKAGSGVGGAARLATLRALARSRALTRQRLRSAGRRKALRLRTHRACDALCQDSLWCGGARPSAKSWRRRIVAAAQNLRRQLRSAEGADLHALRIRARRSRCTLEALGARAPRRALKSSAKLQRVLGDYCDCCVAEKWLAKTDFPQQEAGRRQLRKLLRDKRRRQHRRARRLLVTI